MSVDSKLMLRCGAVLRCCGAVLRCCAAVLCTSTQTEWMYLCFVGSKMCTALLCCTACCVALAQLNV